MGRNEKSKKSTIILVFKIIAVVLSPILYELLVLLLSKLNLGTAWEEMYMLGLTPATVWGFLKTDFWTYFSLVLCRLLTYTLPAMIFYCFTFIKRDKRKSKAKTFLKCLNLQFLGYLIYQGITIILALDYLIGLEPLSNVGTFISMFGYIATISRKKDEDIELGKINNNEL